MLPAPVCRLVELMGAGWPWPADAVCRGHVCQSLGQPIVGAVWFHAAELALWLRPRAPPHPGRRGGHTPANTTFDRAAAPSRSRRNLRPL